MILVGVFSHIGVAVHDEEFQLDGNTADDAALAEDFDWESFFNASGAKAPVLPHASRPGFVDSGFVNDLADPDPTAFQGGDSKDIKDVSVWQCKTRNLPQNKFQLENTYAVAYRADGGDADTLPGDGALIVYAGGERASENGDTNIGVWLLQDSTVNCLDSGGAADTFVGTHSDGDILVLARLVQGGSQAEVDVFEWVGNGAAGFLDETGTTGISCGDPLNVVDNVCAIANSSPVNPPWAPNENLVSPQFFELGINLDALGLGGCFSRFLTNTRSSHEPGSTLHDFALGTLRTCPPLQVGKYIDRDMDGQLDADDGDGILEAGEDITSGTAVSGWSLQVKDVGDTVVCSGTTDTTGLIDCPDLPAGTYTIVETQKTGFHNTDPGPIVGRATSPSRTTFLQSGQPVRLGNTCYVDLTFQVNNVPAGVTSVTARYTIDAADSPSPGDNPSDGDKTEPVDITLSNAGGGTWSGTEADFLTQKDTIDWVWFVNGDSSKTTTGANNVSLASGAFVTSLSNCTKTSSVNFPFASITGSKYKDADGDGIGPESGEGPLSGFQFKLMQGATTVQTVSSSAGGTGNPPAGDFVFTNVAPGTYTIVEVAKTGWLQTEPASGGSYTVTVDLGETSITTDDGGNPIQFGNTPLSKIDVTFTALADLPNGNDATTSTISCTPDGPSAETDGAYTATNLKPGTYTCTVVIVDP
ncbi:MAG: hypothetical protein ACRDJ4_13825 [Actinomycetota bacterium]